MKNLCVTKSPRRQSVTPHLDTMAHFGKDNLWNPKLQTEGFSYFNMKHNNNGNGINLRERITPAVVMRRVMWCAQKRTVWPMFLGMGITLYLVASIPLTGMIVY